MMAKSSNIQLNFNIKISELKTFLRRIIKMKLKHKKASKPPNKANLASPTIDKLILMFIYKYYIIISIMILVYFGMSLNSIVFAL